MVTSIAHDATFQGPDLEQLRSVLGATSVPVVASGGVGALDDLRTLTLFRHDEKGFAGAIVGKAIYERRFSVAEALAVVGE